MVIHRSTLVPAAATLLLACPVLSQSVVRVADLDFAAPEPDLDRVIWLNTLVGPSLVPRVAVEGASAFLGSPQGISGINHGALLDVDVALRGELPEGPLRGTFFLSDANGRRMAAHPFVIHRSDVEVDGLRRIQDEPLVRRDRARHGREDGLNPRVRDAHRGGRKAHQRRVGGHLSAREGHLSACEVIRVLAKVIRVLAKVI